MSNYQDRIEWLSAVVAEVEDLKRQNTTPQKELTKLIKLQAEEIETKALLNKKMKQQKAEYRKANSIGKRLSRSFKAASEAFNVEVEPEATEE